jgi:preprotein translocase subunit SecD
MLKGDLKWKIPLIAIVVLFSLWYLFPLSEAIKLGLDLQGGIHLVLEVQTDEVVKDELVLVKDRLNTELKKARIKFDSMNVESTNALKITASTSEDLTKINDYINENYPSLEKKGLLNAGTSLTFGLSDDDVERSKENAMRQALITIRNRIDEYGVAEPVIQRQGKQRVIVELPGVKDLQRAVDLIGTTAQLRFQLVKEFAKSKEELLSRYNGKIPDGYEILSGAPEATSSGGYGAYLVEKDATVTGADLKDARVSRGSGLEMYAVSFEFDRSGAKRFGTLTEHNIGTPLAIVLDGKVQSAPVIRSKITDKGQITGNFSLEEADDLAIVLRAGALPASVEILQNTSVGASLGDDSIKAGRNAILIGGLLVILFMLFYYKTSGIVANVALLFNLFFVMGVLAYFKATLTLPGLAGIALTVGMAVDANVLIFERIKEELRRGKTLRSAVENGFARAHLTILDANLTTLIAAIVLFQFGTGPIKGFAVTLSIGIISTLFTALILSKVIFDLLLQNDKMKQLSI